MKYHTTTYDKCLPLLNVTNKLSQEVGEKDYPGHSSTHCAYLFLDTESNVILHWGLAGEAELKSPNMEKIGFQCGLAWSELLDRKILDG